MGCYSSAVDGHWAILGRAEQANLRGLWCNATLQHLPSDASASVCLMTGPAFSLSNYSHQEAFFSGWFRILLLRSCLSATSLGVGGERDSFHPVRKSNPKDGFDWFFSDVKVMILSFTAVLWLFLSFTALLHLSAVFYFIFMARFCWALHAPDCWKCGL